jgi:hypothetical protein
MADNFSFDEGSGKTGAADDIGGVLHPRVKVGWGTDGVFNDADTASGKALPVQLRDASGTVVAPLTESDFDTKTGALTETAPATDTASSGLNGRLQRIAQRITSLIALLPTSLGANGGFKIEGVASGTVVPISVASIPSHAVTNAGTFTVQASEADGANVTIGTKADAKSTATDTTAITIMSVLKQISASVQAAAASLAGSLTIGTVTTVSTVTNLSQMGGQAIALNTGIRSAGTQRVTIATDDTVQIAGTVAQDAAVSGNPVLNGGRASTATPTAMSADGDSVFQWLTRVGAAVIAGTHVDDVAFTVATDRVVPVGLMADSTSTDSVDEGDVGIPRMTLDRRQITQPYEDLANAVSGAITTAMTSTTTTSLVAAPGAGLRNYITTIIVSNSHATVGTDVIIQDGSSGTTLLTIPAAAVYGGAVINLPMPLRQPTANTALFCANVTTGASTKVSAVGFKAA